VLIFLCATAVDLLCTELLSCVYFCDVYCFSMCVSAVLHASCRTAG
jgi:hypothetical protein